MSEEQETKPQPEPSQEPEPQETPKKVLFVPGHGNVELTEDQIIALAQKGALKHIKDNKEEEPKDPPVSLSDEVKNLREEIRKDKEERERKVKDAQLITGVSQLVSSIPEFKGFEAMMRKAIMADVAAGMNKQQIQENIKDARKKLGAKSGKIDVKEKEKVKEEMSTSTASGKTAGQEKPSPLNRKDFKSGRLISQVTDHLKEIYKKNME